MNILYLTIFVVGIIIISIFTYNKYTKGKNKIKYPCGFFRVRDLLDVTSYDTIEFDQIDESNDKWIKIKVKSVKIESAVHNNSFTKDKIILKYDNQWLDPKSINIHWIITPEEVNRRNTINNIIE
jgi:hypothetical protein